MERYVVVSFSLIMEESPEVIFQNRYPLSKQNTVPKLNPPVNMMICVDLIKREILVLRAPMFLM